jgi:excinuclease UvrABC nuclease subunit
MATALDFDAALTEFTDRVSGLTVTGPMRLPIESLRDKRSPAYGDWSHSSGVYFFEQEGTIQYVGRALPGTGLRSRVHDQCTSFDDPKWDTIIRNESLLTTVGVVAVLEKDWYWAAALEAFLIAKCRPAHNKRSS